MSKKELHQDKMSREDTFRNITVCRYTARRNYEDRYRRFGGTWTYAPLPWHGRKQVLRNVT